MSDYLDLILNASHEPSAALQLRQQLARCVDGVNQSAGHRAQDEVRKAEESVAKNPASSFEWAPDGFAQLVTGVGSWQAGRFETVSIHTLRERIERGPKSRSAPQLRFSVLDGVSPLTDIGTLQAFCGADSLFQVASQFNCLESPGPYVTPVSRYFSDPTQGPRASVSAFPATLLRHYGAPATGGRRFVQQTDGDQIDLLAEACDVRVARNGYLDGAGVASPSGLASTLAANFELIRVGVHEGAEVVRGYKWDGEVPVPRPSVAQVFTSTVAGGGYGGERNLGSSFEAISRNLLRAAYLGTILAAAALRRRRVVLTLIGGGVFQNRITTIWEAILWALQEAEPLLNDDLSVVLNGFRLGGAIDLQTVALPAVRAWRGALVNLDELGLADVCR